MGYEIIEEKRPTKEIIKVTARTVDEGIQPIREISDTAQSIRELNDSSIDYGNFSSIDLKSDLNELEIEGLVALDALIEMKFFPEEVKLLALSKMRKNVSRNRKGRDDVVKIAQGMAQQKQGSSFFERLGGAFGGNRG